MENCKILKLFTGPMKSGKSYHLLEAIGNDNKEDIIIKSNKDTRRKGIYSRKELKYHETTDVVGSLMPLLDDVDFIERLKKANNVFIDEAQFFDDLYEFVISIRSQVNIYMAGLNLNYKKEWFHSVEKVHSINEIEVIELKANCDDCKKDNACYSVLLIDSEDLIFIGDTEYGVLCQECDKKRECNKNEYDKKRE